MEFRGRDDFVVEVFHLKLYAQSAKFRDSAILVVKYYATAETGATRLLKES